MTQYTENQHVGDFIVTKALPIDELQMELVELIHRPTGAQVMYLACDDDENLFSLSFRTLPSNSNGVAHILEHTVLCGSKKFPVKDPFFAMSRRSLNTFMNAMTGSDFTCYPAASQVDKDFYNLLEVYLDAVFHPDLKEMSFLQEGHRLEYETADDVTSPLQYKGVVFNEMKGNLVSPERRLWNGLMEHLVPDLPYAFNSGGDPKEIPDLTYDGLKAFHEEYYHPSHCLFFFYGNIPLEKHLDFIEKNALSNVKPLPALAPLKAQKRFTKPRKCEIAYPTHESDLTKKSYLSYSWLTAKATEQEDVLALTVLDAILMDTDASPLKYALLNSKLCRQAESYLDNEMSEVPLVIICRGCDSEDLDPIAKVIFDVFETLEKEGIPDEMIASAMHQIELSRTEISGDYGPFGLNLYMRAALSQQQGCDAENALRIHTLFDHLREKAKDKAYFPSLIRKYILNNPHYLKLIMQPDPDLNKNELLAERQVLDVIQQKLSESEKKTLVKQAQALDAFQEKMEHQTIDCLPKIGLEDIPKETKNFPLHMENFQELTIYHHACFTNQMLYVDLLYDLPHLTEEELPYAYLMSTLLTQLGSGGRSYQENLQEMHASVGGIGAYISLFPQLNEPNHLKPTFGFRGRALFRNREKLFSLIKDFITQPRLDEKERIKELLMQIYTSLQNKLQRSPLSFAIQKTLSGNCQSSYINDAWHGLKYYHFIEKLVQEDDIATLMQKFENLKEKFFHLQKPHLVISCDQNEYATIKAAQFYGINAFSSKNVAPWQDEFSLPKITSSAHLISSPVAFTCVGFQMPPLIGALSIASQLLDHIYLHKLIREKGGAYGSGANYGVITGNFYFYTYRDPHIVQSLEAIQTAIAEIAKGNFTERDLEEAKISLIQQFDTPVSPGSRASIAYAWMREGKTLETRQKFRNEILSLTSKEIQAAVTKHLLNKEGIVTTFSGKELLEKENPSFPIFPL